MWQHLLAIIGTNLFGAGSRYLIDQRRVRVHRVPPAPVPPPLIVRGAVARQPRACGGQGERGGGRRRGGGGRRGRQWGRRGGRRLGASARAAVPPERVHVRTWKITILRRIVAVFSNL